MAKPKNDFRGFLRSERAAAATAYSSGNAELLTALSATRDPATFLGPGGGAVVGARRVIATNERGARRFAPGGRSTFKILQMGASGDLAFWTGWQVAKVRLAGKPGLIPMKLRVTEIFRRERGAWKLVHRHADMNAKPGAKKK